MMQKEMQIKKNKLLQRISNKRYVELLKFIERVYLADYDLKILMARKFSNLFFALLPLVLQENGNRVRHLFQRTYEGRNVPVIISHRALTMMKREIQSGKYKRILLADDIIIRGRTMTHIYELLKKWFEEAGITDYEIVAYAFVENEEHKIRNDDFEKIKKVEKSCSVSEWRSVSCEIVDIFYLLGTAYTSYVPNMRIHMDSELGIRITQYLKKNDSVFVSQTNVEMEPYGVKAYAYTADDTHAAVLNKSIRIYEYQELKQYVLVPMVMINPISEDVLKNYLSVIGVVMQEDAVRRLCALTADDVIYRAVVYTASALWGWKFMNEYFDFPYSKLKYDAEEEKINFAIPLLKEDAAMILEQQSLDSIWERLWSRYEEIPDMENKILMREEDIRELNELLNDSMDEMEKSNWPQGHARELLGKYLYLNGVLDETRIRKSGTMPKERLLGYPLVMLKEKLEKYRADWVPALLYAIDFGKGSILSSVMQDNGKIYYVSMLHEGEQNFKYLENTYFPFLYGLYQIEYISEKQSKGNTVAQRKEKFADDMIRYWQEKNYFYLKDDIENMKGMYVGANYEDVLANDVWYYLDDEDLQMALEIVNQVVTAEGNNGGK